MIFQCTAPQTMYCCTSAIDFRKSFDGLCGVVQNFLSADPLSGALFVFFNRRKDRIKMLLWDRDGFWIFQKRLEEGTFQFAALCNGQQGGVIITQEQLQLLLYGIDLASIKHRKRFKKCE